MNQLALGSTERNLAESRKRDMHAVSGSRYNTVYGRDRHARVSRGRRRAAGTKRHASTLQRRAPNNRLTTEPHKTGVSAEHEGRAGGRKGARLTIASLLSLTRQESAPSTKGAPGGCAHALPALRCSVWITALRPRHTETIHRAVIHVPPTSRVCDAFYRCLRAHSTGNLRARVRLPPRRLRRRRLVGSWLVGRRLRLLLWRGGRHFRRRLTLCRRLCGSGGRWSWLCSGGWRGRGLLRGYRCGHRYTVD